MIKEYSVGIEVFHRGDAFDPRMDNIVRAEARKLRARLAKYYATEGSADQVRFEFPKGSYAPLILTAPFANHSPAISSPEAPEPTAISSPPQSSEVPVAEELPKAKTSLPVPRPAQMIWRFAAIAAALLIVGLLYREVYQKRNDGAVTASSPSVAVLPFANLGENRKDDSFSDGLTEQLIDSLVRVPGLHVVARTSAFQFKGRTPDAQDVGRRLGVRTVLEGTVQQYGDRLRVTAELDETRTGYTVWSKSFDREVKDVLGVQREISSAIASSLGSSLTGNGTVLPSDLAEKPTNLNPDAYQAWLKGLYFLNKRTAASVQTSIGYFQQSTKIDPNYAPAWLGIARAYSMLPVFTAITPALDAIAQIRFAASRVLELDPSQGGAYIALATAAADELDWAGAESEFRKSLALNPGDASFHRSYSNYLVKTGRLKEALSESRTSLDLDPLSVVAETSVARVLYSLGQTNEAIMHYNQALALDPEAGGASQGLALALIAAHKYSEGIAEADKARSLMGGDAMITSDLGYAYGVAGKSPEARQILDQLLQWSGREPRRALSVAHVYLGLGDKDHALEWLSKAVDQHDVNVYLMTDPRYTPLRKDSRFSELLRRMKLQS